MEDKTPMYMLIMVSIVALVAIVSVITRSSGTNYEEVDYSETDMITGNVAYEGESDVSFAGLGKFLLGIALVGAVMYMYKKEF